MGLTQWDKFVVETIPIPNITAEEQGPFIFLADSILSAKAADSSADTAAPEAEVDRLVYELYELTSQEIAILESIEPRSGG